MGIDCRHWILAWALGQFANDETARAVMKSYDAFLAALDDELKRKHLKTLDFGVQDDALFEEQRKNDRSFRDALEVFFFDSNDRLGKLTRRYGVF